MYAESDLPPETFEPPTTPKGRLRAQINRLTVDLKHAIKNKLIFKIKGLLELAYDIGPTELEDLICHGELILKQSEDRANEAGKLNDKPKLSFTDI